MGVTPKIAVALADKNPLILRGLKSLLEEDERFELAVAATDGERFLDAMERTGFDVAVIGWVMPYLSGRDVLEKLSSREAPASNRARIVIYTGDPSPDIPRRALQLGAAGFCSKQEPPEKLLDIITSVAGGTMVFPLLDKPPAESDPLSPLTRRERQTLEAVARGLTNTEAAVVLGVSVNTIKFHLRNLYDKLNVHNRALAVRLWHETMR